MQENQVNVDKITFQSDSALVTLRDPGQPDRMITKRVAIEELLKALGSLNSYSKLEIPENCRGIWETRAFKYFLFIIPAHMGVTAVAWENQDTHNYGALDASTRYDEQDQNTRLMYAGKNGLKFFKTPFPDAAILVKLHKIGTHEYRFASMHAWALKSTKFTLANTPVYRWPFFNMYNDARVCIGNIPEEYQNAEAVASITKYLFIGIGNHDLDNTPYISESCAARVTSPFGAVKYLHEHNITSFPQDMLVHYHGSLLDLIEGLVANAH